MMVSTKKSAIASSDTRQPDTCLARKRNVTDSFLFLRPGGAQLTEIGKLLKAGRIQPVIERVFPFEQAKEALEYLAQGDLMARSLSQ